LDAVFDFEQRALEEMPGNGRQDKTERNSYHKVPRVGLREMQKLFLAQFES
jgi:hypothetical protein